MGGAFDGGKSIKEIKISVYPVLECKSNIFRLQKDAAEIIRQYQRSSGLSASYILSEIVRQTRDEISFVWENPDV